MAEVKNENSKAEGAAATAKSKPKAGKKESPSEGGKTLQIMALRNCSHGKMKFYTFKRYEVPEDVAVKLAATKQVRILTPQP